MNQRDDSFGADGRTVIRPGAGQRASPTEQTARERAGAPAEPTVFFSGAIPQPAAPAATVIYQGPPIVAADEPGNVPDRFDDVASRGPPYLAFDPPRYEASNGLVAAAAPVLLLVGYLRSAPMQIDLPELSRRLTEMIAAFDVETAALELSGEDLRIAKFALCEVADDIVTNLPGVDKGAWLAQGMLRQFFKLEQSGSGFFEALNHVLADPEKHYEVLELMHACLSLGFEGQYRAVSGGQAGLQRVRTDAYETLRYFRPRAGDEISPHWQGLSEATVKTRKRVPLWVVAAASFAAVTCVFFVMRSVLTGEGDALAAEFLALSNAPPVAIQRAAVAAPARKVAPEPAEPAQLERVRAALAGEIEAGQLSVDTKGDYIVVEVNNQLLFQSGGATLKKDFTPVAERIVAVLASEKGPVRIVGHTDNVKPRRAGTFKSNYDLSVARAKAVEGLIASKLGGETRVTVEGKGEDEPIAENSTAEGRARNRRIDIMLRREETL